MADNTSRSGVRYADSDIVAFVDRVHAGHDAALTRAFAAPDHHGMPAIQVSPSEGRLLELLLRLASARRVVEVGTLAGYSAIRMARALPDGGRLYTLESDPRHARVARDNLRSAGLDDRVEVRQGPAIESLGGLEREGPFDVVFLDADKGGYPDYGRWAERHLRPGGLLLADNAYLFGNLMKGSEEARAMRRFHEQTAAAFDSVCVPTPDGLVVAIKRG
ncbi:MAG: O-methyltransferase [Myxococcales bacterium]|jgi:caffeoyl-CoA O-methyltransferase